MDMRNLSKDKNTNEKEFQMNNEIESPNLNSSQKSKIEIEGIIDLI